MFAKIKNSFISKWLKINSLFGISVAIKIGVGLLSAKIISICIGPSGMAIVGNFRNFFTSVETISTLGFQNGIVKYIAENKNNNLELKKYLSTTAITVFAATMIMCCTLFFLATVWSSTLFENNETYANVFQITAILLPCYIAATIFLLIINGLDRYRLVVYITIFGNMLGLVVSYLMVINLGVVGALLTIVVTQTLQFFVLFYYVNLEINIFKSIKFQYFDWQIIKNLSSFSIMTIVSAVFVPMVFLSIRQQIISTINIESAGYWTTIDLISSYYFLFVSTIISVFYFPKLSIAKPGLETKLLFVQFYKTTIPIFGMGLVLLFFIKSFVIKLLFTPDFLPVQNLFFFQLLGDFFKALSLILAYNLIAKKHVFWFLTFEIISVSIMYFSSLFFLQKFKIEGIVMAHFLTYFTYFLALVFYNRKSLLAKN